MAKFVYKTPAHQWQTINHFTSDESRWIRSPSSVLFIHEKLGVKQVVLNALVRLTFVLYFYSRQGPRGWSPKDYLL